MAADSPGPDRLHITPEEWAALRPYLRRSRVRVVADTRSFPERDLLARYDALFRRPRGRRTRPHP